MSSTRSADAGKLFKPIEYKIINDQVVKFTDVKVHEFSMGDVEDPDLYAAQPLYEWQQSEQGKWIMEHAAEPPFWHRHTDPYNYGYKYYIIARLKEQDQLYWALKWQKS
jgi:hypothetical protein